MNVVFSCLLSVVQQAGHVSITTLLHPALLFLFYRRCVIQVWVPLQVPVPGDLPFVGVHGPWLAAAVGSDTRTVAASAGNHTGIAAPGGQGHHPVCMNATYFICIF